MKNIEKIEKDFSELYDSFELTDDFYGNKIVFLDIIRYTYRTAVEECLKSIDENIRLSQGTHRIGTHSDTSGGEDDYPCDCDKERRKSEIYALECLKKKIENN
jgi:hypothetical protein